MINNLTGSVTFPSNQISLMWDMSFAPGITAVVGDNGSGKTFTSIEVVRAMLYGKRAFRGPATDYKSFECVMDFDIRGVPHRIERNKKAERFLDGEGNILAVGAEAVNARVLKEMGFGLEVFDVVCASVQKQSDRLSLLTPTARKKLIDDVLGLTSNETTEKACRTEATGYRREAEAIQSSLVKVEEPVMPAGYRPSKAIGVEIEEQKQLVASRATLQQLIDKVGLPPVLVEPIHTPTLEAYIAHEAKRAEQEAMLKQVAAQLARIPEPTFTAEELDIAEARLDYTIELKDRGPRPTITMEAAREMQHQWAHIKAVKKIGETEVECPKCDHIFRPGTLAEAEPPLSEAQLINEVAANTVWATELVEPPVGEYILSRQNISEGRVALARAGDRVALQKQLAVKPLEDMSEELHTLRTGKAAYDAYVTALAAFTQRSQAADDSRAALAKLPLPSTVDLNEAFTQARIYESQLAAYNKAKASYDEGSADAAARAQKAVDFKEGADALQASRADLKAFLAPSMSRVASALIFQMTGGVFSNVVVDEDMNILVDGQEIATLSGAGSTAANLALRLALGQVLTRGTFPVMILDEADSDMRPERAAYLQECLGNLRDQLKQIIIITHKEVSVADYIITR